jgi:hypothetical protein
MPADPKQTALDYVRESQEDAGTRNRGPLAEERSGIVEYPQIGELPIEGLIARIAVEAHRHRFTVIRCGGRFDVVGKVILRWHGAIRIVTHRFCRRRAKSAYLVLPIPCSHCWKLWSEVTPRLSVTGSNPFRPGAFLDDRYWSPLRY